MLGISSKILYILFIYNEIVGMSGKAILFKNNHTYFIKDEIFVVIDCFLLCESMEIIEAKLFNVSLQSD